MRIEPKNSQDRLMWIQLDFVLQAWARVTRLIYAMNSKESSTARKEPHLQSIWQIIESLIHSRFQVLKQNHTPSLPNGYPFRNINGVIESNRTKYSHK